MSNGFQLGVATLGRNTGGSESLFNFTLNQNTDQHETIFQADDVITITRLGVRLATITGTSPTYKVSLQGVDASGNPDGTIKGGGLPASAIFNPGSLGWSANTWHWITLDNPYTCARGEFLSHVISYSSGTIDGANNCSFGSNINGSGSQIPYPIQNDNGVRTRVLATPCFGYGSISVAYGCPIQNMPTLTFASAIEWAMKFTLPATWGATYKVLGVRVMIGNAAGSSIVVTLYDSAGTVLQNLIWDGDVGSTTAFRWAELRFDETALTTLAFGSTYRLGFAPQNANNINLAPIDVAAAADFDAWPGGQQFLASNRTGAGAWTDTATRRFICELILADWTEPVIGSDAVSSGDMVKDGVSWAMAQLSGYASRTVSYSRKGTSTGVNVAASVGQTPFRYEDNNHSRIEWSDRDYLIDAVLLAGTFGVPKQGDQIVDGTETYEVVPYNQEPCFRKADPYGVKLRIHTKRVR